MYFKFTEEAPEGRRKLKYEAVLIEARNRIEAAEILLNEFPEDGIDPASFIIEETADITSAKSILEKAKSFIIIHSAKKIKESNGR